MPYKVKRGVVLVLSRPVERLLDIMEAAVDGTGLAYFWVTSGVEGGHGATSLHYEARALDVRNRDWTKMQTKAIHMALATMRKQFPSLHFLPEADHLHIEWRG